jgi:hypothetical protein
MQKYMELESPPLPIYCPVCVQSANIVNSKQFGKIYSTDYIWANSLKMVYQCIVLVFCINVVMQANARLMGTAQIYDTDCTGQIANSFPWSENQQCSTLSSSQSVKFDCTTQKLTQFNNNNLCSATATTTQRNFTCKSYNISGTLFGLGYTCEDVSDSNLFLFTEGQGDCNTRGTVTKSFILQADKCQGAISLNNLPTTSYRLTRKSGGTIVVSTYFNSGICNTTASNLTLSTLQSCAISGGSYYLLTQLGSATFSSAISSSVIVLFTIVCAFLSI